MKPISEDILGLSLTQFIEWKKESIIEKKRILKNEYESKIVDLDEELDELEHHAAGTVSPPKKNEEGVKKRRKLAKPILALFKNNPNKKYTTKEVAEYIFPELLNMQDGTEKNNLYNATSYALSALAKKPKNNLHAETGTGFKGNNWIYKPNMNTI